MQISADILRQVADSENKSGKAEKNVLFLALSSFSIRNNDNTLRSCHLVKDEKDLGEYDYQLEPILRLFSFDKKPLDEIVVLCTKETLNTKTVVCRGEELRTSEYQFFTSKVKELFPECVINPLPKEYFVDHSRENVAECSELNNIKQVIKELRCLKEKYLSEQTEMSLTIDIHGGHRSTQMQVQNIISLLRYEGIIPKEIYTVNFSNDTGIGRIIPASETIDINKFVSGMNEFFSYGRINTLDEYYAFQDNEFVKIVRRISDAIQLCDIPSFDEAIKEMKTYVERYQESNDYVDLFIDAIKSSYGKLLDREGRKEVINKIKWCVENNFIQQALTIIESQMPQEFKNKHIVSYTYDYDVPTKMVKLFKYQNDEEIPGGILFSEALDYAKPEWESPINFVLASWLRKNCCTKIKKKTKDQIEYCPIEICGVDKNQYLTAAVPDNCLSKPGKIKLYRSPDHNDSYINGMLSVDPHLSLDQKKDLTRLFRLHMALKEQRNASNHAVKSDRASVKEVTVAINAYIELAEKIFDSINQEQ